MANAKRNLDPFGDASLLESFTFKTDSPYGSTINSQKGDNYFLAADGTPSVVINGPNGDYFSITCSPRLTSAITLNPIQLSGPVDATFAAWVYCYGYSDVCFGEMGQRYNLEIIGSSNATGTTTTIYVKMHKQAWQLSIDLGSGQRGWHHVAVVCDSVTEVHQVYVDGTFRANTPVQALNWNNSKGINFYQDTLNGAARATDIMYFKRKLTAAEVLKIYTDDFPALPSFRTADPFLDGSLLHSFMGESFGDDQKTKVLKYYPPDGYSSTTIVTGGFDRNRLRYWSNLSYMDILTMPGAVGIGNSNFTICVDMTGSTLTDRGSLYFDVTTGSAHDSPVKLNIQRTSTGYYLIVNGIGRSFTSVNGYLVLTVDRLGSTTKYYTDGALKGTVTTALDLRATNIKMPGSYPSGSIAMLEEFLIFTRTLSDTEAILASNHFTVPAVNVTVDPSISGLSLFIYSPPVEVAIGIEIAASPMIIIEALDTSQGFIIIQQPVSTIIPIFIQDPLISIPFLADPLDISILSNTHFVYLPVQPLNLVITIRQADVWTELYLGKLYVIVNDLPISQQVKVETSQFNITAHTPTLNWINVLVDATPIRNRTIDVIVNIPYVRSDRLSIVVPPYRNETVTPTPATLFFDLPTQGLILNYTWTSTHNFIKIISLSPAA